MDPKNFIKKTNKIKKEEPTKSKMSDLSIKLREMLDCCRE